MDWTKVNREEGDPTKVDRTKYGWFVSGWFTNWFAEAWGKICKEIRDWNKVDKDTGTWNKINKE